MGSAVSRAFRRDNEEKFNMLLVKLPANQALFATKSIEEISAILSIGQISVGNAILIFRRRSTSSTKIEVSAIASNHWIRVWGLPLSECSSDSFAKIGRCCGGLLEVDQRMAHKEVVFTIHLKVVFSSLNDIPRLLQWQVGEQMFSLVIEVEKPLFFIISRVEEETFAFPRDCLEVSYDTAMVMANRVWVDLIDHSLDGLLDANLGLKTTRLNKTILNRGLNSNPNSNSNKIQNSNQSAKGQARTFALASKRPNCNGPMIWRPKSLGHQGAGPMTSGHQNQPNSNPSTSYSFNELPPKVSSVREKGTAQ